MKAKTIILFFLVLSLPIPQVKAAEAEWLEDWDLRVQIEVDSGDVDTALTYFPVLVYLSDNSGINGSDVSFIFDEVGAESRKIAITKADGTTELYVEIEKWDEVNEEAWLWVSKSDWEISDAEDTLVYFYYDNDHVDNVNFVGVVSSAPGETVWDANFIMVLHLSEGGEPFIDSTSNDNDAGSLGDGVTCENELIDGTVNLAGSNDYLRQETAGLGSGWDDLTIESWVKYDNLAVRRTTASAWGGGPSQDLYAILYYTVQQQNRFIAMANDDSADLVWFGSNPPSTGVWYHLAGVRERNSFVWGYENGAETLGGATPNLALDTYGYKMFFGQYTGGGLSHDGDLDEIRLSDSRRSADWIEVTYETGRDHLITFGVEQTAPPEPEPEPSLFPGLAIGIALLITLYAYSIERR